MAEVVPVPLLRLVIPNLPAAEYAANYARGQHWSVKQKITQRVHDEIIALVHEQGWKGAPLEQANVSVCFVLPDHRRRDPDGLISRMKPYFDGLVLANVLKDDDLQTIGWPVYRHTYVKGVSQTIIEVHGSNDPRRASP